MGQATGISWCDHTFNPWIGCAKVSPACANCYAERDFDHRKHRAKWGVNGTRSLTGSNTWSQPKRWNTAAEKAGIRKRVFCASLADVFEDWQGPLLDHHGDGLYKCYCGAFRYLSGSCENCGKLPHAGPVAMDDVRRRLFALIDATPNLDWLLLTKRPENIQRMWPSADVFDSESEHLAYWPNVWLGTSVESQEYADKRIPELLKCRSLSPVLFLSCEPLLGPVDIAVKWDGEDELPTIQVEWVIAGGESGPDARPSHPEWFSSLRDQCDDAEIPFHFKQWGEWVPGDHDCVTFADNEVLPWHDKQGSDITPMCRVGVKRAGRMLDGVVHDAIPD